MINYREVYTRFAKYTVAEMDCPVCESSAYKLWGRCLKREVVYQPEIPELITQYVKCKKCAVVYGKNSVIGYNLYVVPSEVDKRIEHLGMMPDDPGRHRFNLELIKKTYIRNTDFSLLDIGCSGGEFLELALDTGIYAEGVEINPKFADKARKRTNSIVYEGDICEVSIPKKYDVINLTEIIEHVLDPNKFLNRIFEVLNPGGMIFITTMPNNSSIKIRIFKCKNPMIRETFSHHVLYNPKSMKFLLQKNGFSRIRFYHYKRDIWSIKDAFMSLINRFGYFDNQVIATAWK